MGSLISGIHHVTALCSDAQTNLDFYAGILGLRLVKKTVNFDAPEVYHLYYGDETGSPGTILTFFPYQGILPGRKGTGQVTTTSFSIDANSVDFWVKRLLKFNIAFVEPQTRFDEELVITFEDSDGLGLELVASQKDERLGYTDGNIPQEHAIKGFYGITLMEEGHEKTAKLLTGLLDHQLTGQEGNRFRYSTTQKPGDYVDLLCAPDSLKGLGGGGTIHHVAFATKNDTTQLLARDKLLEQGFNITPVLDREYFHSVYFREPGGVLFEIATLPPGFAIDEDPKHLGENLKLPPWYEKSRTIIEKVLPPLTWQPEKWK